VQFPHIFPIPIAISPFLQNTICVKFIATILTLALSIALVLPVAAQEPDPWKAKEKCIFGMPYLGHAVKRGSTGLVTEILKAVYEPTGIEFLHKELPYVRAMEEVRTGEIHCTLAAKDSHKLPQGDYTLAYYDLAAAYLRKTGFDNVQSLAGKRVAYLHGFELKRFLPVKFTPQQIYDLSSGFHMLDRKHVAYLLGDNSLLLSAMRDSQLPTSDFMFTDIKSFEIRPVFAPTKEGKRFRNIYNRRMKEMLKSGELTDLMRANGLDEKGIQKILQAN